MSIIITGSVAYDYLMSFPGRFSEHILPEQIHQISLSFLVDSMRKQRGGCAPNIAYTPGPAGRAPHRHGHRRPGFWRVPRLAGDRPASIRLPSSRWRTSSPPPSLSTPTWTTTRLPAFTSAPWARPTRLSFHDLDYGAIEIAIISPNAPGGHGQICPRVPGTGHSLHLRPQPADHPPERRGTAGRHRGARGC